MEALDGNQSSSSDSDSSDEFWTPSKSNSASEHDDKQPAIQSEANQLADIDVIKKIIKGENSKREKCEKSKKKKKEKCVEKKSTDGSRRKVSCPLLACKAKVVHLPRHMRNVHKWTSEAASKVLLKFNIRKKKNKRKKEKGDDDEKSSKKAKHKDYHRRRRCPINDCHTIVFRLSAHLQKVHKLDRSSKEYCDALASATVVPDIKHPKIRYKELHYQHSQMGESFDEASLTSCSARSEDDEERNDEEQIHEVLHTSNSHPLVAEFEEWMSSPDGGKRDDKTVKQHAAQLLKLLTVLGQPDDVASLLDVKLIQSVFLNGYVKDKEFQPGTIKSYLMSLRHYYTFLLSHRPDGVEFHAEDVRSAREKIQMWSKSYKKEACTRRLEKQEEDLSHILTPENICLFEKSEAARLAIKILGEQSNTTEAVLVTQNSYTLVRDFLFTQIFIDNANRPGVLTYMTISEYQNMRTQDDDRVIVVKNHKTRHVHGPAYIVLSKKLEAWLSIFVERMRPQVTTSTSGYLFLSWNGKRMSSSQINKAVQSVFKKAGVKGKVTTTSFRKSAVTNMHQKNPEFSEKLAKLMAHNESTAKKHYLLSKKAQDSVEASKKLGAVMRNQPSSLADCDGEATCTKPDNESTGEDGGPSDVCGRKRVAWTADDLLMLEKHFSNEISTRSITLDQVRTKVEENDELQNMSPRRVYDRLKKHITKINEPNVIAELPEESESLDDKLARMAGTTSSEPSVNDESSVGIVPPTEKSGSVLSEWDIQTINKMFDDMVKYNKPVSKVEIKKRCSSSQEGQKLLKHLSVFQIINRIKYAKRKFRENPQK
jgi:site-specific recombinase XerD